MSESGDSDDVDEQKRSRPRWKGAQAIGLAHQLNEQLIDLLCDLALNPPTGRSFFLIRSAPGLWNQLDRSARRALAQLPFVIVDLRFGDEEWWRAAAARALDAHAEVVADAEVMRRNALALETLMFAWQVAREDRGVAQMLFALSPSTAECIARLTMQQVRTIAPEAARRLDIHWGSDVRFWSELVKAARVQDGSVLDKLRREAKLRFLGELIHAQPASGDSLSWVAEPRMPTDRKD